VGGGGGGGGRGVTLYGVYRSQAWERVEEDVDNLVLITGRMQEDRLLGVFKGKVEEVHLVGDARIGGARIGNAIYDAQKVARTI
jgi:hypothetical protein